MTQLKLCKDCKYFRRSGNLIDILFGDAWHSCSHPEVTDDVVNAKDRVYCKIARVYRCGYDGKFWEAK